MTPPLVSAVIPTLGGTGLNAAVNSCLEQSEVEIEVIVAYNGDGRAPQFEHPSVRVITSPPALRGNGARAAGIREARGAYIALLDDDDVWLPDKARLQIATLAGEDERSIASCWIREINEHGDAALVGPPFSGTVGDVRDFLFVRRGLLAKRRQLQTSTILGRAAAMRHVEFDPSVHFHQDWTWILAQADSGIRFLQIGSALVERRISAPGSVSRSISFQQSADWARVNLRTRRQLGDFLLVMVLPKALRQGDWRGTRECMRAALVEGWAGLQAWLMAFRGLVRVLRWRGRTNGIPG